MSKFKMNCGYCGKKCNMEEDFCVPQDSVYVCKSCYNWHQQISDLEAKLAESEKEKDYYQDLYFTSVKGQEKLKQQLAEKDNKIQMLNAMIATLPEHDKELKEICDQDKISFCIEKLEKVKSLIENAPDEADLYDEYVFQEGMRDSCIKMIDNQIEQLKKEIK